MTIETLRKAKKDTIRTLMRFGTAHPVLKYPVFLTTVIFIFVYNLFLHTLIQIHVHEKFARVMAVILSVALIFTGMDLTALAVRAAGEQGEVCTVLGFAGLSEETTEQRVSAGTPVEELKLPDALEAYIFVKAAPQAPEEEKNGAEESAEPAEPESVENGESGAPGAEESAVESTEESTEPAEPENVENGESEAPGAEESAAESTEESTEPAEPESVENGESGAPGAEESAVESTEESGSPVEGDEAVQVYTAAFVLPIYLSENVPEEVTVETLENGGDTNEPAPEMTPERILIGNVTWKSAPLYDSMTAGVYSFTPVLPEGYILAEGVSLPQIRVTVEEAAEDKPLTAAGEQLDGILRNYFGGVSEDGIYDAVLAMSTDTRLALTAEYEELLAALTLEDAADGRLQSVMGSLQGGLLDAAARVPARAPMLFQTRAAAPAASGSIALKRISGSGKAFIYHSFEETTVFKAGRTYAFLDDIYGFEDAVAALGSGAILNVTGEQNNSLSYIQRKYGDTAEVKCYVGVEVAGRDFDSCMFGGLYQVPGTAAPTEYRYFCYGGGAKNCGPYYAYNYQTRELSAENVSASLNSIDRQGSERPEDYTVTLNYDGKSIVLDKGSYSVQVPDPDSDALTIVVADSAGNEITVHFRGPLAVRYEGNAKGAENVPATQTAWKGNRLTVSGAEPARSGYAFVNWKDKKTGTVYGKGQTVSSMQSSLQLLAQWRDTEKPKVTCSKLEVLIRTSNVEVEQIVRGALTITDNEPVSECSIAIDMEDNIARRVGDKTVTVTVTDKAGNATVKKVTVTVMALSLELGQPVFAEDTKNLSSVLISPGGDAITETGFVWGIMTSPSTALNNGKGKTASPVTEPDAGITVNAASLQKGVTYYARAYAIAGGVTYYSNQISFGLDVPRYGSFTIANNGNNQFTVTRTGGSEGEQKVYYRTVNGSAVGGTHFTHQAAVLTFAPGETSKTITVAEAGANAAYTGKPATAFSNADRTYFAELYRVTGGGTLGSTVRAARNMASGADYKVDRSIYTVYRRDESHKSEWSGKVTDKSLFNTGFNMSMSLDYGNERLNTYISNTAYAQALYLESDVREEDDGYQHIKFTADPGGYIAQWRFEIKPDETGTEWRYSSHLPNSTTAAWDIRNWTMQTSSIQMPFIAGEDYLSVPLTVQTIFVGFDASGSGADDWHYANTVKCTKPLDKTEPQIVAVAPMAGGLYKAGDSFTVSLIFDEIVDSVNSKSLSQVRVKTNWGEAVYAGGADTNVLYFTGTVQASASGSLRVTEVTNPGNIRDMCDTNGTAGSSKGGDTGASVDTAQPNFTLTSRGVAQGTGTVQVKVAADQAKTNALRYAWSDSTTMPVTGWVDVSSSELDSAKAASGLSLSIRKEPGSGSSNGKWYLHVIGTYNTTGATVHKYAEVNFGTPASPSSPAPLAPTLSLSADNSSWATSRNIRVTTGNAAGGSLQYRKVGTTVWTTLSVNGGSITVNENGYYTFRLTVGEHVLSEDIEIEKIDRIDPTAEVGTLSEGGTVQTTKAGVYTKLTIPISFSDAQSGVQRVEYVWTNTPGAPVSGAWQTLAAGQVQAGRAELSCTAAENMETAKYLHIKVTDRTGHTVQASSAKYQVISQAAVDAHTPKITLTGAPSKWINDTVTLTWRLENYSGKRYEVILPDGRKARESANVGSGECWAMQNGTYTVKVRDLDYGGENTATVEVRYIDKTAPTVKPSAVPGDWKNTAQTVTFSADDSQSGVGKKYIKIVSTNTGKPLEGLTELTADSVTIAQDGVWYVYYKYYDRSGDDSAGREANKTEGFAGPFRIDRTKPEAAVVLGGAEAEQTGWYTSRVQAKLTFSDPKPEGSGEITPSGVKSVAYQWIQSAGKPAVKPESGLQALTPEQIAAGEYMDTQKEDGVWYLYYKVTDQAGNMTDGFSEEIKLDTVKAGLTVTGPAVSGEKETGLALQAASGSFGPSGGALSVKKDGESAETTLKSSTAGGVLRTDCRVTEPGTYHFYSRTGADETPAVVTRYVHQAAFDCNKGSGVESQLVWTSYADADENTSGMVECKVQRPADPRREGYLFSGWYTDEACETAFDFNAQLYEDITLYAKWTQDSAPEIGAKLSIQSAESGWHTERPQIDLTYVDTYGVMQILVSVDGGAYQVYRDFAADSPASLPTLGTAAYTNLLEGDHTYTFQAVNTTDLTAKTETIRVRLDTVKPVLGEVSYNEGYTNLWNWIIHKESLQVSIPVTEGESGLARVTYTLTPGSMQDQEPVTKEAKLEREKTAEGTVYTAVIRIDPDYKGVIGDIQAVDAAGNVSEVKTAYANGIGVIVEEQKPVITVTADRLPTESQAGSKPEGEALSTAYYQTAPELLVKVQDGSMAASGLKEVKWQIEGGSAHTEDGRFTDALRTEYSFRITELAGYSSTVQVKLTALDHAGNSQSRTVTVNIKGKEQMPQTEPDYLREKLTGLLPEAGYVIRTPEGTEIARKADADGEIVIGDLWFGQTILVVRKGDGANTEDSDPFSLQLAARPAAPGVGKQDETVKNRQDGQITGLTAAMELSKDGGRTWMGTVGNLSDAAAGKYLVRLAATQSEPHGRAAEVTVGEGRTLTVTFDAQGGSAVSPVTGLSWQAAVRKPADPVKEDVAFAGWFQEKSCENRWHFASEEGADRVEADITLYARWIVRVQTPSAEIDYRAETLTGLTPGQVYLIGGKEVTASGDGTVPVAENWFGTTIPIVQRGDGIEEGDSSPLQLPVPNRPAGPEQVVPVAESCQDGKDGRLTETGASMQYRKQGSTAWIPVTGAEVAGLEPGQYELRYVSTDTRFASKTVVRTVGKYSPPREELPSEEEELPPEEEAGKPEKPAPGGKPKNPSKTGAVTKPGREENPGEDSEPGNEENPGEGSEPGSGEKPGEAAGSGSGKAPGEDPESGNGEKPEGDTGRGNRTAAEYTLDNDRIVPKMEAEASPCAVGGTVKTLTIPVDQGAVIVTVNNMDESLCTAQAADAAAVANAVLTSEEALRVSQGETVEIRIDVERIDHQVNEQEAALIEQEIEGQQKKEPGLTVGMYVDISMFRRQGGGEWNAVHETKEPVKIVIDIPESLQGLAADFFVLRAHEGTCTLLRDLDDAAETITIETECFSTYAIAYRPADAQTGRCGLCHRCPTFLGICCFVWLAIILLMILVAVMLLWKKPQKK